jgi:hypothetical protein
MSAKAGAAAAAASTDTTPTDCGLPQCGWCGLGGGQGVVCASPAAERFVQHFITVTVNPAVSSGLTYTRLLHVVSASFWVFLRSNPISQQTQEEGDTAAVRGTVTGGAGRGEVVDAVCFYMRLGVSGRKRRRRVKKMREEKKQKRQEIERRQRK